MFVDTSQPLPEFAKIVRAAKPRRPHIRTYDCIKGGSGVERFVYNRQGVNCAVVVLTNDSNYWTPRRDIRIDRRESSRTSSAASLPRRSRSGAAKGCHRQAQNGHSKRNYSACSPIGDALGGRDATT